jgi:5-methylcytosine-specific restriction endonuclease McrA
MRREYYTVEWFYLKEAVLRRDGYTCRVCAGVAETAHHITYRYGVLCAPRWLVSVCWSCHARMHGRYNVLMGVKKVGMSLN